MQPTFDDVTAAAGAEQRKAGTRWGRVALGATAASAVATAAFVAVPNVRFAYHAPAAHVAIETLACVIVAFAALVAYGRMREDPATGNLLLFLALWIFAAGNFLTRMLPMALDDADFRGVGTWGPLFASAACALTLVAGSVDSAVAWMRRVRTGTATSVTTAVVVVGAAALLIVPQPATGLPVGLSPAAAHRPLLAGSAALLALRAVSLVAFTIAGVRYVRHAADRNDSFTGLLGIGCLLLAFARLQYLLFPPGDRSWFYFGDLWRLGGFVLVLAGASAEMLRHWRRLSEIAVLDERRRIARELHDGLAQELAFLAAETRGAQARAAQRALDESRRAIAALTRPLDEPLDAALCRAAEEVAMRYGRDVGVHATSNGRVPPILREQVIRIAREAVGNAARHSGADRIELDLRIDGDELRLLVEDDGRGFDPTLAHGGHGLISMRERAEAMKGTLRVDSSPGRGSRVELLLPV